MTGFFLLGPAPDADYVALRDSKREHVQEANHLIEHMWSTCRDFLDADLRERARENLINVFWELYLAFALYSNGVPLVRRKDRQPAKSGPDLLVAHPRAWIEAVAPGPGEGADRVPDLLGSTGAFSVPDEQLKLRLRSVIEDKHNRLLGYETKGWLRPDEPAVIAISGAALGHLYGELNVPRIVRVAFPIGHEHFHIDVATTEIVGRSHRYAPVVRKQSGSEVSTELFLTPAYKRISALLYSGADPLNRPHTPGAEMILVLNPYAATPIASGTFPFMHEYRAEGHEIHYRAPIHLP